MGGSALNKDASAAVNTAAAFVGAGKAIRDANLTSSTPPTWSSPLQEAQEAAQREKQRLSYLQQKAERERCVGRGGCCCCCCHAVLSFVPFACVAAIRALAGSFHALHPLARPYTMR